MLTPTEKTNIYAQLRAKAEEQLKAGTAPAKNHWSIGVDALRLLHQLSSDPTSAQDALKLLHELQVHQVELDLQNEEIAANELALVEDLNLYRGLYDSALFGYFLVDFDGIIIQGNTAAGELFEVPRHSLEGRRIDTFLTPENRPLLLGLLQRVAESDSRDTCMAEIGSDANGYRHLQFLASVSPQREYILLACCEYSSQSHSH